MHWFLKFIFGIKLYMFRTVPLSIIRSFSLYTQQTCMTYTIAVCTVKNSWWWTEELSETCRLYFKNKFEKLVHLVGFIIRIYHDARSPERHIIQDMNIFGKFVKYFWIVVYAVTQFLRHCATSRKVAVSIPVGVTGILHWLNSSGRTMALKSTQSLTEMSTRDFCWGKGSQ